MQKPVDLFDTNAGWVFTGGASYKGVNTYAEFISGNLNTSSQVYHFNGAGDMTKTPLTPIDIAGCSELVFSVWSRELKGWGSEMKRPNDFKYRIDIQFALAGPFYGYYIPLGYRMQDVTIKLPAGVSQIFSIVITSLHTVDDYIMLSNMVVVKDEIPLDIFSSIKEVLDADILAYLGDGIEIGDVAAALAGDDKITITGLRQYADKYAVVKIKDSLNSEIHQLGENDEVKYAFTTNISTGILAHNYTNAKVYLQVPVSYGVLQKELELPSVGVWGMAPEAINRGAKLESIVDTYRTDGTLMERRDGQIQLYRIFINIMSRSNEINAIIGQAIRTFIAREKLFINGRKFDLSSSGPAEEIEPVEPINDIFKHVYELGIEVKEDIAARVLLPVTTDVNGTVGIMAPVSIP